MKKIQQQIDFRNMKFYNEKMYEKKKQQRDKIMTRIFLHESKQQLKELERKRDNDKAEESDPHSEDEEMMKAKKTAERLSKLNRRDTVQRQLEFVNRLQPTRPKENQ